MSNIIKHIRIDELFGTTNIDWELNPSVNVLVGQNGSGKTTILKIIEATLKQNGCDELNLVKQAKIIFSDDIYHVAFHDKNAPINFFEEALSKIQKFDSFELKLDSDFEETILPKALSTKTNIEDLLKYLKNQAEDSLQKFEQLSSYSFKGNGDDSKSINIEFISTINLSANSTNNVKTSSGQDASFLDYEINNEILRLLSFNDETLKDKLISALNSLFSETQKTIEFDGNKLVVKIADGRQIDFDKLSSGERQVIFIFLKVVNASVDGALILMDEPEISLHLSWQEKLLNEIRRINTTSQIIIVTHSPALLMNGWMDSFVDISDIMTDVSTSSEVA